MIKLGIEKPDLQARTRTISSLAEKTLGIQMEIAKAEILKRTQGGRDVDNRQFAKYSNEYRDFKIKRTGKQGAPDLLLTGHMNAAMQSRAGRKGRDLVGEIYFSDVEAASKARAHMEGVGKRKTIRRFFALSELQIRKISEAVKRAIIEALSK